MEPTTLTDEAVATITGLPPSRITAERRKHLTKGEHFESAGSDGITWTDAGLRKLAEVIPHLAPAVDEFLAKKNAPPEEELVVVGPHNDMFIKACRESDPAKKILVRMPKDKMPLYPTNFKFRARRCPAFPDKDWMEPVKHPRWRGRA